MSRNIGRLRFRQADPRRDLHVPRRERKTTDPADGSDDGTDPVTGENDTDAIDPNAIRAAGGVVSQEDLT